MYKSTTGSCALARTMFYGISFVTVYIINRTLNCACAKLLGTVCNYTSPTGLDLLEGWDAASAKLGLAGSPGGSSVTSSTLL